MKKYFAFTFFVITSVWSEEGKVDVLPQYVPQSHVTRAVEEFLNQKTQYRTASVERDVMGRQRDQLKTAVFPIENRMKVIVSDLSFRESMDSASYGRYENDVLFPRYWLNNQLLSKDAYVSRTKKENEKFYKPSYVDYLTAKEIRELLSGPTPVLVGEYKEPKPSMTYSSIFTLSQINTHAFTNNHKGNGVGVYFNETGCPETSDLDTDHYSAMTPCYRGYKGHPTGVARILQETAPQAMIYGYDEDAYPNPNTMDPQIDVGSHSWTVCAGGDYCQADVDMDDYIYNNRVINFVCAGNKNFEDEDDDFWVKSPGLAVNAITVGAVDPMTRNYASYSAWRNSDIRNQKPEVANFTDFFFPNAHYVWENGSVSYNGFFDGTSASTPYMAGMVADLLQDHVFYKRHPEVVKALLLTANSLAIGDADHDRDNYANVAKGVPAYSDLAWNNRSAYWNGPNGCCFDDGGMITKIESNIVANHHYRIAIAWLTPATYVYAHRMISQDLDLFVYQDGELIARSESSSNPFEVVDFFTTSSSDLIVKIKRYSNSGMGDVVLGYNFWHNQ
ncbi:MAG: S8 family peptidase [Fibrobacter sp.]|nr:S8 family peptidase [Fibrobacter sp.]